MNLDSNKKINQLFKIYTGELMSKNSAIAGSLREYRKKVSGLSSGEKYKIIQKRKSEK